MAEAAETIQFDPYALTSPYEELVFVVPEQQEDTLACMQAERLMRHVGQMMLTGVVERPEPVETAPPRYVTLMDAIHAAAGGDETARQVVANNVRTDHIERTIKAGVVLEVELESNAEGKILQHGQTMEDVHINTLLYGGGNWQMRERIAAETRNAARIERYSRQGRLEDYYFVVISRAADNMTEADMTEAGFFTDTLSCSIQATHQAGDKLVTESAFVAGKQTPESTPYDAEAVVALGAALEIDLSGKTATELIDTPLLVHKGLMPNGVIDLVKLYDAAAGTFFGQAKPAEDYLAYRQKCRQQELDLGPAVENMVDELIMAASDITTPVEATRQLHLLSQKKGVDRSITDTSIDPRVFGSTAAEYIEDARTYMLLGDVQGVETARQKAQQTAKSSSCPTGSAASGSDSLQNDAGEEAPKEEKSEIKRMTCPFCGDSKQYGDPCSPHQYCTSCRATVRNGKVVSTGDGGKRRREQLEARKQQQTVRLFRFSTPKQVQLQDEEHKAA